MSIDTTNESRQLEQEKWNFERQARTREIELSEKAQETAKAELDIKKNAHDSSKWWNPLVVAVFAATVAAFGNAGVSFWNAGAQRTLESEKAEQARILEMIKTGDPDKAAINLRFLLDAGLITDQELKKRIAQYLESRQIGSGPTLPTPTTPIRLTPPIVENARVFLLAGNSKQATMFSSLRDELASVGFLISGAKVLQQDPGRPDGPEVRYFNPTDKDQAEKIAEVMRFRLNTKLLAAKEYSDSSVKPGYLEIWLGR